MEVVAIVSPFQCHVPTVHTAALKAIHDWEGKLLALHAHTPPCHVLSSITQLVVKPIKLDG